MLGLLILAYVAHAMQPQAIGMAIRSLFSAGDRNSMFIDTALDKRAQALMVFFASCMLSMSIYISLLTYLGQGEFSLRCFGMIILYAFGIFLLRTILQTFVSFTFVPRSSVDAFLDHYYHLTVCTALAHYPILLVCLFFGELTPQVVLILNIAVFAFYFITLLVKMCFMLIHSVRGFSYILIYLLTLEIIPFAALVGLSYQLITNSATI